MTMSSDQLRLVSAHDWLHVFEEDRDGEEVYRRADTDVPAARRPRERLRVAAGGAATVFVGGADDRSHGLAAEWHAGDDDITVQIPGGPAGRSTYRIVSIAQDQLRIHVS
jgi:hypothetical protein